MEGLVPNRAEVIGRRPTRAEAGIRAVEEKQAAKPLRMLPRQALGGIGADVMRDDASARNTKAVHERKYIGSMDIGGHPPRRGQRHLFGVAEAAEGRGYHIATAPANGSAFAPDGPEF